MTVLIATMYNKDKNSLLEQMNLQNHNTIIINQTDIVEEKLEESEFNKIFHTNKRGLSSSRNDALNLANEDAVCQIADDDMVFVDNYEEIVQQAYNKYPKADIIAFYVGHEYENKAKKKLKEGKLNYLTSMKLSSVQISFKKKSIINNNIKFDERFGIGSEFTFGEENIFLVDCLKKGLSVYSYPVKIAILTENRESYWNRLDKYNNCIKRGAVFKRMTNKFYLFLILQYAIRKRTELKPLNIFQTIKLMIEGAKKYSLK